MYLRWVACRVLDSPLAALVAPVVASAFRDADLTIKFKLELKLKLKLK